jgi:hypothetical protein
MVDKGEMPRNAWQHHRSSGGSWQACVAGASTHRRSLVGIAHSRLVKKSEGEKLSP